MKLNNFCIEHNGGCIKKVLLQSELEAGSAMINLLVNTSDLGLHSRNQVCAEA